MAFYKGFSGHYHLDPWGLEHRASMAGKGWRVFSEDPLAWRDGDGVMAVIPAPSDDIAAAQWFVAGLDASGSSGPDSLVALLHDLQRDFDFVVDLWAEGATAPSDCLPDFFMSLGEAREAGWGELLRVARAQLALEPQDPARPGEQGEFDWAQRFTIRPCRRID